MATGGHSLEAGKRETSTLKEMERKMRRRNAGQEPGEDLSALKSLLGRNL